MKFSGDKFTFGDNTNHHILAVSFLTTPIVLLFYSYITICQ